MKDLAKVEKETAYDRANQGRRDVDVAVNIFAKPWQTALSLLSLNKQCGSHIGKYWLQFEPMGSEFDKISPYWIVPYMVRELGLDVHVFQPDHWQARKPASTEELTDEKFRRSLRYGTAFEDSKAPFLFLTHNDIFMVKDLVGALRANINDAFAIGQLGQCWNCPASQQDIMEETLGIKPCGPESYQEFKPTFQELKAIYKKAREKNFAARPYEKYNFSEEFEKQPWPLPECRVNEWACLISMDIARPYSMPHGPAWPPGVYRDCSGHNLDVVTPFFRDLHARGLHAKNFDIYLYMKHWIGTGNKSRHRYTYSENRALRLLKKFFPDYSEWIRKTVTEAANI